MAGAARSRRAGLAWVPRLARGLAFAFVAYMLLGALFSMLLDLVDDYGGGYRNLDERRDAGARLQAWFLSSHLEEWSVLLLLGLVVGFALSPLPAAGRLASFVYSTVRGLGWALAASVAYFFLGDAADHSPSHLPYTILAHAALAAAVLAGTWSLDWVRFRAPVQPRPSPAERPPPRPRRP